MKDGAASGSSDSQEVDTHSYSWVASHGSTEGVWQGSSSDSGSTHVSTCGLPYESGASRSDADMLTLTVTGEDNRSWFSATWNVYVVGSQISVTVPSTITLALDGSTGLMGLDATITNEDHKITNITGSFLRTAGEVYADPGSLGLSANDAVQGYKSETRLVTSLNGEVVAQESRLIARVLQHVHQPLGGCWGGLGRLVSGARTFMRVSVLTNFLYYLF